MNLLQHQSLAIIPENTHGKEISIIMYGSKSFPPFQKNNFRVHCLLFTLIVLIQYELFAFVIVYFNDSKMLYEKIYF